MPYFVGLDSSKETTQVCVINPDGVVVQEGSVETHPRAILGFLRGQGRRYRAVGIEATSNTWWLYEGLTGGGLPVICIEARHAHGVLQSRKNKTDRNDAAGIAEMMRAGIYRPVHVKTQESQEAKLLLATRNHLSIKRRDLDHFVYSVLLARGIKLKTGQSYSFAARAGSATAPGTRLGTMVTTLLETRAELERQIDRLDALIADLTANDPVCRRLITAPGVGTLTALSFKAAVDSPDRFARSRDVAVHLGLTPRSFQTGATDRKGRISKGGDQAARRNLFMAGQAILRRDARPSALRSWGLQIAERKGKKKALVAVARKLAVILHRMWTTDTDFIPWPTGEPRDTEAKPDLTAPTKSGE